MTSLTRSRPRVKPGRNERYAELTPAGEGQWLLHLTAGDEHSGYWLSRVASDWGDAYRLRKVGLADAYHVCLADEGHSCECMGFLRWGHCKHTDAVARLQDEGLLCPCRGHAETTRTHF